MDELKKLKKFWKGKNVFITGHTGFKGAWLSIFLNILGAKVYGYSLKPHKNSLFNEAKVKKIINKNYFADIKNYKKLNYAIKDARPQLIFHLASQALVSEGYKNPYQNFDTNLIGTLNLLDILKNLKINASTLIITTDKVYKNLNLKKKFSELDELGGIDPYSASKVCQEILSSSYIKTFYEKKNMKGKISTVRSGNVIGGGDYSPNRLIPDLLNALNSKKSLKVRNPKHIRPWQHVIEPLFGYLILSQEQFQNNLKNIKPVWNFGPDKKNFINVSNLVKIFKTKESKLKIAKYRETSKFLEKKVLMLSNIKSKTYLKWKPKWNLTETVDKILNWNYQKNKIGAYKISEEQIIEYLKLK